MLSSVASLAVQYFSTLSHKQHDPRKKKVFGQKMCVLISSTTFIRNIFYSKTSWARYGQKYILGLHVKYPCQILMNLEFSRQAF